MAPVVVTGPGKHEQGPERAFVERGARDELATGQGLDHGRILSRVRPRQTAGLGAIHAAYFVRAYTSRMPPTIRVRLASQTLELVEDGEVRESWPVSTALRGAGEQEGSEGTPRGRHTVCEKIGAGAEVGAVFVGRQATGECCTPERFREEPERDWILTRILWLDGLDEGRNRGGDVDSRRRFIYIHGTPDETRIGVPASHGCVRMRNDDVVTLFDRVEVGTRVEIVE